MLVKKRKESFKRTDEGKIVLPNIDNVISKATLLLFSLREDGLADHQTEREHGDVQVKVALSGKNLNNMLSSNGYLIPTLMFSTWSFVLGTT